MTTIDFSPAPGAAPPRAAGRPARADRGAAAGPQRRAVAARAGHPGRPAGRRAVLRRAARRARHLGPVRAGAGGLVLSVHRGRDLHRLRTPLRRTGAVGGDPAGQVGAAGRQGRGRPADHRRAVGDLDRGRRGPGLVSPVHARLGRGRSRPGDHGRRDLRQSGPAIGRPTAAGDRAGRGQPGVPDHAGRRGSGDPTRPLPARVGGDPACAAHRGPRRGTPGRRRRRGAGLAAARTPDLAGRVRSRGGEEDSDGCDAGAPRTPGVAPLGGRLAGGQHRHRGHRRPGPADRLRSGLPDLAAVHR